MAEASDLSQAVERHLAGEVAEAERLYRDILSREDSLTALRNLALILDESGRTAEARAAYERGVTLAPDDPASYAALGNHARRSRALEVAEAAYRQTLALQPDHPTAAADLGMTLLAQGRYPEGWTLFLQRKARRRMLAGGLSFPEWKGEPLTGKRLFVWREQGFGDQILAARFLKDLGAAEVTYACAPALRRLVAPLGVTYVEAPLGQAFKVPPHDYWTLPLSLPAVLGVTLESLPTAPYMAGNPRPSAGRVGFVWSGEATNPNQRFRALPPALAERLLARPGVVSLAVEDTGARDFQDTADLIAGLDLVISVDTAVAHLAGAMGRPVWVLVGAHGLDWHWLRDRTDSPWYPSARLFRQPAPGDWESVVRAVETALDDLGL